MCARTLALIFALAPHLLHVLHKTFFPDQGLEDIVPLVAALEAACKGISMLVRRAAIAGATGVASGGGQNAGGDEQKKLDVVSNDLLKGFLARSGVVRVLASEEVCVLLRSLGGIVLHGKGETLVLSQAKRNIVEKRRLRSMHE